MTSHNLKICSFFVLIFIGCVSVALASVTWEDFVADDAAKEKCFDKNLCTNSTRDCTKTEPASNLYAYFFGYEVLDESSDMCSCDCDDQCHVRNTCCEDVYDELKIPAVNQQCVEYNRETFYAVTACPEDYSFISIKELCHTPVTFSTAGPADEREWFAYSDRTSYTYRNFYCALCNGESYDDLVFWPLMIGCDVDSVPNTNATTTTTTPPQPIITEACLKILYSSNTVQCPAIFIGTCPINYPDKEVVYKCLYGPMAIVDSTADSQRYRNVYCMICNGGESEITCELSWPTPGRFDDLSAMSLTLLVHPFDSQCQGVGDVIDVACSQLNSDFSSCAAGQMFNVQSKSCENLCPHPYIWKNRNCDVFPIADMPQLAVSDGKHCNQTVTPEKIIDTGLDIIQVLEADSVLLFVMGNRSQYCVPCQWSSVDAVVGVNGTLRYGGKIWARPFVRITNNDTVELCLSSKATRDQFRNSVGCSSNNTSRDRLVSAYSSGNNVTYFGDGIEVYGMNGTVCMKCHWISVQEYELPDTSNIAEVDGKEYAKPFYYELGNDSLMICADLEGDSMLWSTIGTACLKLGDITVSAVTITTSILCLVIMLVVYALAPVLQNVPGYIVLSEVISLLLALLFYLLRLLAISNSAACYFMSFMSHYLFLAAYFWSFIFGVEVLCTLNTNSVVNQQSTSKFIKYSIAGWTVPAVPVIIALVMDNIGGVNPDMQPQYGRPICWFTSQYGLYLYFLLPMAVVFSVNLVGYIAIIVTLAVLVCKTKGVKSSHREKLILSVKLIFACGLLWVFGILSAIFKDNKPLICIFMFLNGLYGLVLLLTFLTSAKLCTSLKTTTYRRLSTFSTGTAFTRSTSATATALKRA